MIRRAISLYVRHRERIRLACGRAPGGTRGTDGRRREEPYRAVSVLWQGGKIRGLYRQGDGAQETFHGALLLVRTLGHDFGQVARKPRSDGPAADGNGGFRRAASQRAVPVGGCRGRSGRRIGHRVASGILAAHLYPSLSAKPRFYLRRLRPLSGGHHLSAEPPLGRLRDLSRHRRGRYGGLRGPPYVEQGGNRPP